MVGSRARSERTALGPNHRFLVKKICLSRGSTRVVKIPRRASESANVIPGTEARLTQTRSFDMAVLPKRRERVPGRLVGGKPSTGKSCLMRTSATETACRRGLGVSVKSRSESLLRDRGAAAVADLPPHCSLVRNTEMARETAEVGFAERALTQHGTGWRLARWTTGLTLSGGSMSLISWRPISLTVWIRQALQGDLSRTLSRTAPLCSPALTLCLAHPT